MRAFFRFSDVAKSKLIFLQIPSIKPKSLLSPFSDSSKPIPYPLLQTTSFCSDASHSKNSALQTEKRASDDTDLIQAMSDLAVELSAISDPANLTTVLASKASSLFRNYPDGSASIGLLNQLKSSPQVALERTGLICSTAFKLGRWCSVRDQDHSPGVPRHCLSIVEKSH